jgi:iron(II)-dependent oxidoreductase
MLNVPATDRVSSAYLDSLLRDARRRTRELTGDLDGPRLFGPKIAIVNPAIWEVGHVGFFHDYFALRALHGLPGYQRGDAERLYDSSAIAHDDRWELPLPDMAATWDYVDSVLAVMLSRLSGETADETTSYVYQLTALHEDMHGEALMYTRQTLGDAPPVLSSPDTLTQADPASSLLGDVFVPGGTHRLGSEASVPFRFDNEKQAHEVPMAPFRIARAPVTNAEFAAFVDDGGYRRSEFWSKKGYKWLADKGAEKPNYWIREAGGWHRRRFDQATPLPPHQPVVHVNYYEAEAYCNWAGRRLPTEAEWEVAASRVPEAGGRRLAPGKRLYPWGDEVPSAARANLDGHRLDCADVAAFAGGDSGFGCRQMLGNVWEWTASTFAPYPGFAVDLYRDYSQPWFPEGRKVLRGGAWATRSRLVHNSHRNFFLPDRNDIYAGFRTCALGD